MLADLEALIPDAVVDARSLACPGPLLAARKAITTVQVGQTVEVQSGDSGTLEDIPAWSKKTGQEYLGSVARDGYQSLYVVRRK